MAKQKQSRAEKLNKKRIAEKKRYEKIKNDETLWKEKQEKNKQAYLRRKEEKKQLPINDMTPRQQRIQRKKWRINYKSYHLRKKQEKRTLALLEQSTPPMSPLTSDSEQIHVQDPFQDPLQVHSPRSTSTLRTPTQSPIPETSRMPLIQTHSPVAGPSHTLRMQPQSPVAGPSRNLRTTNNPKISTSNVSHTLDDHPTSRSSVCSSPEVRRVRYKKDKEINRLHQMLINLKKQNINYRKQILRMKTEKESKNENKVISVTNKSIRKVKQSVRKINLAVKESVKGLPDKLKTEIGCFYEDDENSRLCSGKKEFIVRNKLRKQKRFLNDSLLNLHKKFLKNSSSSISYSAFCKLRPFWVLAPDSKSRETCLCMLHTNMDLILQGLYQRKIVSTKTPQDLISLLCCDPYDVNCLQQMCSTCKDKAVPYQEFNNSIDIIYWQWITKQEIIDGNQKKIRTTEKVKITEEPLKCIDKFESMLKEYLMHCGNICAQQKAFKILKEHLKNDECIVHVDFSENFAVKCNQEIQSYHFGGSRKQITLHTSVIYYRDDDKHQVQSFCTISDCLRHDVSAVWAHIVPILEYLEKKRPGIQTIHFISDSPSSQYRNKKIFHVIASLNIYLNSIKTITWNYSEAGHGKGAPDGIGAVLKRTADRAVSQGQDIKNVEEFVKVMEDNLKSIILRTVSEYEVSSKDFLFPELVKSFKGCMKMHQLVWKSESNKVTVRKLSCTEEECLYQTIVCPHNKHLGFYQLIDSTQNDFNVIPLASVRNQSEVESISFEIRPTEKSTEVLHEKNKTTKLSQERKKGTAKNNKNILVAKVKDNSITEEFEKENNQSVGLEVITSSNNDHSKRPKNALRAVRKAFGRERNKEVCENEPKENEQQHREVNKIVGTGAEYLENISLENDCAMFKINFEDIDPMINDYLGDDEDIF